jgi:hypothetical protein
MFVVGVNEFTAYLVVSYFVTRIPRKTGLMISIFVTSSIGLLFLLEVVQSSNVLQSVVVSLTRIGSTCCYSLISLLQVESFPAEIKSSAVGLTVGSSQVGRIILPYMITAVNDLGIHQIIVSSVLYLLLGIIPLIPLKETLVGKKVEDSLL